MDLQNIKILVVDDEDLIRWSLERALKGMSSNVDVASSGEEALEKLNQTDYDVVVTDFKMPGLSGLDLLAKISEKEIRPVVIIISAYLSHSVIKAAMEFGAYRCMDKPFVLDEFVGVVKEAAGKG